MVMFFCAQINPTQLFRTLVFALQSCMKVSSLMCVMTNVLNCCDPDKDNKDHGIA